MRTNNKMAVVYSLSRNLYPYLRGAIRSLLDHNEDVKIYVLAEDDDVGFDIPCEHQILNMSQQIIFPKDGPNMRSQFTYMAMLRACTAELIPEEKIIQLDIDTIVCDSLRPIWEIDLRGKWVAWAPEIYGHWQPFSHAYYNFGVCVQNLGQLRRDNAVRYMVHELNNFVYTFLDQDVMNRFALPDKSVIMPARFNECFCCGISENPAIVHFAGWPNWYTIPEDMPRREYLIRYAGA